MTTIKKLKWGEVRTSDGKIYKDAIVHNGSSEEWNWLDYGLRHNPGYTPEVLKKIFEYIDTNNLKGYTIILSVGIDRAVRYSNFDPCNLHSMHTDTVFLQSEEAHKMYNNYISRGKKAIIFLHSTC
jgi:hypothetical protein